ncbi:MAG TPA: Ig-like domain-containing protein, partial [Nocardioides sp.]|nr:Ig-like domain-containing protein [Nocardioides sp.]
PVGLSGGTATSAAISTLGLGFHDVTAVHLGTADHAGSESAPYTFRVRNPLLGTTTTSTVAPTSAVYGQPVTLSADVTSAGGDATGSVTFTSGSTTLATTGINGAGHAEVVVDDIPVGSHQVVATYSGDDVYAGSVAAPKNLNVTKAEVDVALSSSDTSTVTGEAVNFTATVGVQAPGGGSPSGTVQLRVDGADIGAPVALSGGTATFPAVTSLGAGNHTVAAVYSGSPDYDGGQDSLQQDVSKADTSTIVLATPSPAVEGEGATLTARIGAVAPGSGAPTGTVSFTANGDSLGAAPLQAVTGGAEAVLDISDLAPGTYSIVTTYAGDADYDGSASEPVSHQVIAATAIIATSTVLTSSENPSTYGELVTFTANVTAEDGSAPAGTVQFSVDGDDFGDPVPVGSDGVAESATLASPDPGDHTVIAAFTPATGYSGSGDILTQTVDAAGVDVGLTSSAPASDYGQGVTFTATVTSQQVGTGSPGGFVQLVVDGQPLGDAVELDGDGVATSQAVSDLLPGDHDVRALYSGDVHFVSGASSITQSVAKVATSTTLTATPTSTTYGQTVELRATVTPAVGSAGTPGGTVTFMRGTTAIATVPVAAGPGSSAVATVNLSDLGAGSHAIRAEYAGTAVFAASTSAPVTVNVGQLATSLKTEPAVVKLIPLGLPLGLLKVTLTGGGQPVVGAPIDFRIGPNLICTSTTDAQGVATCNARPQLLQLTLALGYKASYAGDANHLPAQNFGSIIK